ncbi:single-stranded DNA-binding protein [Oligella ureolytica]
MEYINEMTILGNLSAKPELRYLQNDRVTTVVRLATNEYWVDRHTGEKQSRTTWHRVILWDQKAKVVAEYMDKGDRLWVRGQLQVRTYTDSDGISRQIHEVQGREIKIIQTKANPEKDHFEADEVNPDDDINEAV